MHGSRPTWTLAALAAWLACAPAPAAVAGPRSVVRGELLVRFDADMMASERAAARRDADTPIERSLPLDGLQLVRVESGDTMAAADARLERQAGVLYAEPNRFRSVSVSPNDPLFGDLWGLVNAGQAVRGTRGVPDADIDADAAWDLTTGAGATVAVVDSGVDVTHPDLAPNAWANGVETVNGADDDADGHVDDVAGWDWVDGDNDPRDLNGHGTHVAGTVAARGGDAAGVAGVAWDARLMPLRILDANGSGTVADAIEAYEYAAAHGARVLNASFGSTGYSLAEHQAIQQLPELLFVVAAGNDGTDNDVTPHYPCAYPVEHLVCVAASKQDDRLAGFSNYGTRSVDVAAPGTNVVSSLPGGGFGFKSGTSMATPQVAGAAALVSAQRPGASAVDLKRALLAGAEPHPALAGKVATGGRLNALWALAGPPQTPSRPAPPAGAPAPAPAPDTVAPRLAVRVERAHRLRTVLRRGIRLSVTCSEACLLGAQARLRSSGLKATRTGQISGRGTRTLAIRLGPDATRRLRQVRRATVAIAIRATDPAGNRRSVRRVLRVERGR